MCEEKGARGMRRAWRAWRRSLKLNASSDYADRAETRQGEGKKMRSRETAISLPEATGRNEMVFEEIE